MAMRDVPDGRVITGIHVNSSTINVFSKERMTDGKCAPVTVRSSCTGITPYRIGGVVCGVFTDKLDYMKHTRIRNAVFELTKAVEELLDSPENKT